MGAAESEPVAPSTAGAQERNVHAVDGTILPSKLFAVEDPLEGCTDVNHIPESAPPHQTRLHAGLSA